MISPLVLLLSHSVHDLLVRFANSYGVSEHTTSVATACLLHTITLTLPRLTNLAIFGPIMLYKRDLSYISSFPNLQDIALADHLVLDANIVRALSAIQSLEQINFAVSFNTSSESTEIAVEGGFHEVSEAHLTGAADDLVQFFTSTSMPKLVDVELLLTGQTGGEEIATALTTMFQHISKDIRSLHVTFRDAIEPPPHTFSALIEALFVLRSVKLVDILFKTYIPSIEDEDLSRLAHAWPQLEHLKIRQSTERFEQWSVDRPTTAGVINLASSCPKLETVHLPQLNGTIIPTIDDIPCLQHGLLELSFEAVMLPPFWGRNRDSPVLRLADVFDIAFPNLDTERSGAMGSKGSATSTRTAWGNICWCICAMQRGREHHRL